MRLLRKTLFSLALIMMGGMLLQPVNAQQNVCGSDELKEKMMNEFPAARISEERSETIYERYAQAPSRTGGVQTIPCVVHVIQTSELELVTMATIQSQLDVLTEDFRKMAGTAGFGNGVDTEYEFCLATIDPNGCPTIGVNRIVDPVLAYHDQPDEVDLKSLIQWPPTKYLNIWVPRAIVTGGSGGGLIVGYATFPTFLPFAPSRDGIVIHSGFFGRNNQSIGRTTTHEVGHWLGLYHTFQGGCSGNTANTCSGAGDRVCDTPQAAGQNFGCPVINSCVDHNGDPNDQIENYMDYSNGTCQDMLTAGQKVRMDFHTQQYRGILTSASNLAATGCDGSVSAGCAPSVEFEADVVNACANSPIVFTDLSQFTPTSWDWTFTGGSPATSTSASPTVTWPSAGTYNVTLKATNSIGNNTETKSGYITITDASQPPLVEGFESILFLPAGWSTYDALGDRTWELANGAGSEGQKAMKMVNYESNTTGSYDDLISKPIDLSWATAATMTFDHSYKKLNGFASDSLQVFVSSDCGSSWTNVFNKGGPYLATVAGLATSSEFVPDSDEWVGDTISLDSFVGTSGFVVMWRNVGADGQSIYIDNINISFTPVGARDETQNQWSLAASPNPFSNNLSVTYDLAKASEMHFSLTDINGKVLFSYETGKQAPGNYSIPANKLNIEALPSGIYFLQGESAFGNITRKLMKID